MATSSGIKAAINNISSLMNWSVSHTDSQTSYVNSATNNGTQNIDGPQDWTGSINATGAVPSLFPGETFSFSGQISAIDTTDGNKLEGNVLIDQLVVNWNWATVEAINHTYNFGGHVGLDYLDDDGDINDTTTDDNSSICGTKIQYSTDGTTWTTIPSLVTATLTITAANSTYVNSSTHVSGTCWTGRKQGPINWTLSMVQEDDRAPGTGDNPAFKTAYWIRAYTNATQYWQLKFGKVSGYTGVNANRDGTIVNRTIGMNMMAASGGTAGGITLPGAGSAVWGS